ncbi:branched-chain amino acid transporter [Bacillus canaveralius]|uniref:Branched-chain amino acid transporter n=1 Tax=Bacillus canaveralius TaxID=1403243 RepID=A0A2N5GPM3_9BACI|nr:MULTISPECIES: AzlD domain-containing protein [Bacillus]PLR84622.1 branched-chain amino acid transporter [Bacillus canaveralius]PLR87355.1 branched-chain amino acid transporter [Bacillus sp. V33-4]PLS00774.1 branched-chain amino acid transporter [Bacillus canaveralius]RSK53305.1 AzlD domain-containing protein [Bacillus canaveralius]
MSSEIVWMIIGMGVVTYIPRMLPFVLFQGKELPAFLQGVLRNVPYATLGALIFPGILFIQEDIWYGLLGAAAAFIVAYLGANVIIVVLGSIAVLTLYSYLF